MHAEAIVRRKDWAVVGQSRDMSGLISGTRNASMLRQGVSQARQSACGLVLCFPLVPLGCHSARCAAFFQHGNCAGAFVSPERPNDAFAACEPNRVKHTSRRGVD